MKSFFLISSLSAILINAQSTITSLSPQQKNDLANELRAWKLSEAGRVALVNGFYKESEQLDAVGDDQLNRFYNSKQEILRVGEQNPEAIFSTDTPFALMTNEEFSAYVKRSLKEPQSSFRPTDSEKHDGNTDAIEGTDSTPKDQGIDWTTSGCVAAIKNQGQCGSCWAFSAVSTVESAYCLKYNKAQTFSDQQITSCSTNGGSMGCDGGWPSKAMEWIQQNGICKESDYRYISGTTQNTETCKNNCRPVSIGIKRVTYVGLGDSALVAALNKQPISVVVSAGNSAFRYYQSGVLSSCDTTQVDHAVVAVGYGTSGSSPYFKVRNSWGTTWGSTGYIFLKRIVGNTGPGTCQVTSGPYYPSLS